MKGSRLSMLHRLHWLQPKSFARVGAFSLLLVAVGPADAATVSGVVRNGTNQKVAAGVDVVLMSLQGDMEAVASTTTDAQGNYTLDHAQVGQAPMLIRAIYQGVRFHQPVLPGRYTVDVTVYDSSSDPKLIKVGKRVIVFQPSDGALLIGEEYGLENKSQPPQAYFDQAGDFDFELPEGGELAQVSSWGPAGMPVVQGTIDRGERRYAIAYAFQPGESGVRLSYRVPYASNQANLRFNSIYSAEQVLLVAPPSVRVESAGFFPAGTEGGFNLYARDVMPAGLPFEVSISGTAPPAAGAQGGNQLGGSGSGAGIQALPNRLDSLRWILIAGFAALFALGVTHLWRRPAALVSEAASEAAASAVVPAGRRGTRQQVAGKGAPPPVATVDSSPSRTAQSAAEVANDAVDGHSLDALKDKLFRLELRHQAGTISDEEYARGRSRTEQILRELVRG